MRAVCQQLSSYPAKGARSCTREKTKKREERRVMPKGYWIVFYRRVMDPARLSDYAALAGPAIEAGGGRFLARGMPVTTFEGVEDQRSVVIEFDSVEPGHRRLSESRLSSRAGEAERRGGAGGADHGRSSLTTTIDCIRIQTTDVGKSLIRYGVDDRALVRSAGPRAET